MHSNSNADFSMSFNRWDFNSSAKKSVENPLELSEPAHSRVMSLENMLKELDEEEKEEKKV